MLYDYDSNIDDHEDVDIFGGDGNGVIWEVDIQPSSPTFTTLLTGTGDGGSSSPAASYEITIELHLV